MNGIALTPSAWGTNSVHIPVVASDCSGPIVVTTTVGASNAIPLTVQGTSCGTTPPLSVSASVSPLPNSAGWNNSNVTVSFACSGGVAPVTCPSPQTVSTEGMNQTITGTATDASGATASASVVLNIDKTVPIISAAVSPLSNGNGWNNTVPVTVTFTCSDALSGISTCPSPVSVNTSGAGQVITGKAIDKAGNSATASVTLNIAITPPTITATAVPAANANGWNNTPVSVTFACLAGDAPVTSCPSQQVVSQEGADQIVTGTVTDVAGNFASTQVVLNVDLTLPSITPLISPPAQNGLNTTSVTVTFSCTDSLSGVAACPPAVSVTTPGSGQVISGTVTDDAGNSANASVTLNVQNAMPSISPVVTPLPNSEGWNNSPVTVMFQCQGGVAPIQCPSPKTVSSDGFKQTVSGTVTDAVGHVATANTTLNIDQTSPLLNVITPASETNITTAQISVQGLVADGLSEVKSVVCGSTTASISGNGFTCNVSLTLGNNTIPITATDAAGNSASANLVLVYSQPISVQITSPTTLQLFSANPVTVTGNVGDPTATVTVGGVTATVNNGTFTASGVVLREGKNFLTASATSPGGGVGSDTVSVYLDTTPPVVHIDNPIAGATVISPEIDVTGNVNDMVTGTVNADQVSVSVNGVNATIANRTFAAHGVLLVPGSNTITAVATDRAGNTAQHQVQISLQQLAGQTLSVVSGNDQSGQIGTALSQPLVVMAADALGRPMANVALNFAVSKSDGLIIAGQQKGRQLTIQTDLNGQASIQFQLGSRNGAGANQVSISSPGFVGQAVFSADSVVGPATQIHTVSGEMQVGVVGLALPEPLIAIVFDAGGNPVSNVPVTFTVQSGGGLHWRQNYIYSEHR